VVLYEMLAGQPPFTGATAAAITARKLTETVPPLRTVRETVPVALEQVVRKALARTPADRFSTAQRFADALDAAPAASRNDMDGTADLASVRPARWRPLLALAAVALLGAGLAGTLVWRHYAGAARGLATIRFSVHPPPGDSIDFRSLMTINDWGLRNLAISPDGKRLAFVGVHANDTTSRLFLREMGGEETKPIAGTEGASAPFFSPDGEWVAYFNAQDGRLLKVPAKGGQPQIICDCGTSFGADWGTDGWIVMDPGGRRALTGLLKVRESGGRPESVPLAEGTFTSRGWQFSTPQFLPDGKTVLVTLFGGVAPRIVAISLLTGKITDIQDDAFMGQYLEGGYLLFAKTDELWAVRFDPAGLTKRGQPVRVADSVLASVGVWAEFAVSRSGTLVYHAPVKFGEGGNRLVWVDRDDRVELIPGSPAGFWNSARLSPDGSRVLLWGMPRVGSGHPRVWLFDRQSGARPITDDGYTSAWPIFAPDGRHVVSNSDREGAGRFPLFWAAIDGGEKPVRLTTTAVMNQPSSWTPDGKTLAFQQGVDPKTKYDLYTVSMTGDHAVKPLIVTKWNEREPEFSPDGRWLAYASNETGRFEVYVRPFPDVNARRVQVSQAGGTEPRWAHSGRELFFRNAARALVSAAVVPAATFTLGPQSVLFDGSQLYVDSDHNARSYDVAPGDQRFVFIRRAVPTGPGAAAPDKLVEVTNWATEVRAQLKK
jgi:eukaryotic-like serine/threonine-protein kinase